MVCVQWKRGLLTLFAVLVMTARCDSAAKSFVWPSADTSTSDITCWTCRNKANNEDCNDWAPDLKCPTNQTVCQTIHRFNTPGAISVLVTKRCVHTSQCTSQHVGCSLDDVTRQQECVSCCDYNYCNQDVAVNRSTARLLSSFTTHYKSSAWPLHPWTTSAAVVCVLATVLPAFNSLWTLFMEIS